MLLLSIFTNCKSTPLIVNGAFVKGVDNWTILKADSTLIEAITMTEINNSSKTCLKIDSTAARDVVKINQKLNFSKKTYYEVSFNFKTDSALDNIHFSFDEFPEFKSDPKTNDIITWNSYTGYFYSGNFSKATLSIILGKDFANFQDIFYITDITIKSVASSTLTGKNIKELGISYDNLVVNNEFNQSTDNRLDNWESESVEGNNPYVITKINDFNCIMIKSTDYGYSSVYQKIKVQPNTFYKLDYIYCINNELIPKATSPHGLKGQYVGLNVTVREDDKMILKNLEEPYNHIKKTSTASSEVSVWKSTAANPMYINSGNNTNLTISVNLGMKDGEVKGEAYISKINLTQVGVTSVPKENAFVHIVGSSGVNNFATDILLVVFLLLMTIAVILLAIWLISKFINKAPDAKLKGGMKFTSIIAIVAVVGVVLRILLSFMIKGYREEFNIIMKAINNFMANGFSGFYTENGVIMYPLTYFIYGIFGGLANIFGVVSTSIFMQFFIKLPLIICDTISIIVLYKLVRKYTNGFIACIIAGIFSLCPIFFFTSGVWGSTFSILTLGLMLTMYFLSQKKYLPLTITYALCLLTSKDAIYIFPLIAVFMSYHFIKAFITISKQKPKNLHEIMTNKEMSLSILIPLYFIGSLLMMYLLSLPMIITDYKANFFTWIYKLFLLPIVDLKYFGFNALNIFNLFGKNAALLGVEFPSAVFAVLFGVLITAIVIIIYLSKKNRANLVLIAAYIVMTLATYFIDFRELNLVPILGLLLVSFILIKDKRILQIFGVLSFTLIFNASSVLVNAGYLNNASDALLNTSTNIFYTGSIILNGAYGVTVSIICSVLNIITHLYFTKVLLDISMSNKRKLFNGGDNITFLKGIKDGIK